jgi:hypothetical protein
MGFVSSSFAYVNHGIVMFAMQYEVSCGAKASERLAVENHREIACRGAKRLWSRGCQVAERRVLL